MKKTFANYIEVTHVNHVFSIMGNSVILSPGKTFDKLPTKNDVELVESLSEKGGVTIYTQSFVANVDKLTSAQLQKYLNGMPVVVRLFVNEKEDTVLVGSIDIPCIITILPKLDGDQLQFSRDSISKVL